MNTNALEQAKLDAERRVLEIQTKLHRWSAADAQRRFDDLYNLVCDPAFLLVGWLRVRRNKGARTAGVDGETARLHQAVRGGGRVHPRPAGRVEATAPSSRVPARERAIPKAGGKVRYLVIATIRDRAADRRPWSWRRKLIFKVDLPPCAPTGSARSAGHSRRGGRGAPSHLPFRTSGSWRATSQPGASIKSSYSALLARRGARVGDKTRPGPGEGVPQGGHGR